MNSKLDNLDLIRALFITDIYTSCKKQEKREKIVNPLFKDDAIDDAIIDELYSKDSRLSVLDDKFSKGDSYAYHIGTNIVSRYRVLKNMHNYIGDGDPLIEALLYNAECKNIMEVVNVVKGIQPLEMGDNSVGLSKGI